MNYDDDEDQGVLEPPRHDMLIIRFMGDTHDLMLPYCEVANGDLISVENTQVKISVTKDNVQEVVEMGYTSFVDLVEKTFDTKGIVQLSVQLAGSYEQIKVL